MAGPSAWRTASTSASGSLVAFPRSESVSQIFTRLRMLTPSSRRSRSTRCTSLSPSCAALRSSSTTGIRGLDQIDERLDVLPAEQPGGVDADHLREVGGDDRRGIDDGRAGDLGLVAQLHRHPPGVEAEHRLLGRASRAGCRWRRRWRARSSAEPYPGPPRRRGYGCCRSTAGRSRLSRVRTRGITIPSSRAVFLRSALTRASRSPPRAGSTRATRSNATSSSSGSTRMSPASASGESATGPSGSARSSTGGGAGVIARKLIRIMAALTTMNGILGRPGTTASRPTAIPAIRMAWNCLPS